MALITRYVNTASSGGDGTTNGTSGGTAAYASLDAWDAAEATDLVTAADSHEVICDPAGGADTTAIGAMAGWTTDDSNTLTIKAASGSENDGASRESGGTGYQLRLGATCLDLRMSHVFIEDMELTVTNGSRIIHMQSVPTTNEHIYRRCIFSKTDATSSSTYLLETPDADANITLENCLTIGYNTRPMDFRSGNGATIDHCAFIYENSVGALIGADVITNSWFFNNGGDAIHSASTTAASGTSNNACNDGSMGTESWPGTIYPSLTMADEITDTGTDFADPSTVDATIKTDGTLTFDDGGTGSLAADITRTSREGTVDVGPFELISGGGGPSTPQGILGIAQGINVQRSTRLGGEIEQ